MMLCIKTPLLESETHKKSSIKMFSKCQRLLPIFLYSYFISPPFVAKKISIDLSRHVAQNLQHFIRHFDAFYLLLSGGFSLFRLAFEIPILFFLLSESFATNRLVFSVKYGMTIKVSF